MKIDTSGTMPHGRTLTALTGLLLCLLLLWSCRRGEMKGPGYDRYVPPSADATLDSVQLFAVIEIPAGTALQQAIDSNMQIQPISGAPVDFLPFPGNYGFIVGRGRLDTISGVTAPLPVCIMMPALAEGSLISVVPVAVLLLSRNNQEFPIIIAIPEVIELRSIHVSNFVDFITEYDAARHILQTWFLNYLGRETFEFVGWRDEHYASRIIREWKIDK